MPTYRAQFITQGVNGDTKDTYVNTFHLFHPTAEVTDNAPDNNPWSDGLGETLWNFYNLAHGNTERVNDYTSARFSQGTFQIKFYNMADAPGSGPRAVYVGTHGSGPGVQGLPEECAVCLSYSALNSGFNRARRRGRIYIGPLNVDAMDDLLDNNQPVRVRPSFMQTLIEAGAALKTGISDMGWKYRVFSQMDNLGFDIQEFSVDDAFDTIRGRGVAPSGRISSL